jgi:hypothetical protein
MVQTPKFRRTKYNSTDGISSTTVPSSRESVLQERLQQILVAEFYEKG